MRQVFKVLLISSCFALSTLTASRLVLSSDGVQTENSTASFSNKVKAKLEELKVVVAVKAKARDDFNITNALRILFSKELYPFLSRKSNRFDEGVSQAVADCILPESNDWNRSEMITDRALIAMKFDDMLAAIPGGADGGSAADYLINGTTTWGRLDLILEQYCLCVAPDVRLKVWREIAEQKNLRPESITRLLDAVGVFLDMYKELVSSGKSEILQAHFGLEVPALLKEVLGLIARHDKASAANRQVAINLLRSFN